MEFKTRKLKSGRMEFRGRMSDLCAMSEGEPPEVRLNSAMLQACEFVNMRGASFRWSSEAVELMGNSFTNHPDRTIIQTWLGGAPSNAMEVMYFLCGHVISEWLSIPKRTVKEHRKLFSSIEQTADDLFQLMEQTGADYFRGGGHGLRSARISDMLTDREKDEIFEPLRIAIENDPDKFSVDQDGVSIVPSPSDYFPTVEDILARLADAARRLAKAGPIHSQPNKRGARTGYFVRRMEYLLNFFFGDVPPTVLAALASIALNEVVDEDLARKLLRLSERSAKK